MRSLLLLAVLVAATLALVASPPATAQEATPSEAVATTQAQLRAQGLFVRGMTRARLSDYDGAIEAFEAALDLVGDDASVLLALADAHHGAGRPTEALFYANQAAAAQPASAEPLAFIAERQREAGSYAEATATLERLLEIHPDHEDAWAALAEVQRAAGDEDAAIGTTRHLWGLRGQPRTLGLRLVGMLDAADRGADAIGVLETLQEADPASYRLRLDLAQRYAAADRAGEALPLVESVLADYPQDRQAALLAAQLYQATERTDEAATMLAQATDPNDPEALFAEAATRFNQAQTDPEVRAAAMDALRRLIDMEARPEALHMLATLHADAGAYAEAAVAFARAVEVEPRRPDWWAQALDAALLAGDTALAA
ncbi:MAG: tetratricopeptide repeat protein, partial [Bacteroidota bacterium]